jgi:glycine cleavage system H protein
MIESHSGAERPKSGKVADYQLSTFHYQLFLPSVPDTSFYKRATFVTHLPTDYLYSPSHFWLHQFEPGRWRVGFTKFATRMLGEIVEVQWEKKEGIPVASGDIIGSIEGFKAISDIYCVADGTFAGGNTALSQDIELVSREPYTGGWLYEIQGEPDAKCIDLTAYRALLDATIDRILEKQQAEGEE